MRRWFPAIAASLIFHLLLLLLPASVPEASEPPAPLRLVLRHLEKPKTEAIVNSETTAPAPSQPGPQPPKISTDSAPTEVQEEPGTPESAATTPVAEIPKVISVPESQKKSSLPEMAEEPLVPEAPEISPVPLQKKITTTAAPAAVEKPVLQPKTPPPAPRKVQKEHTPVQKAARKKVPPPKKEPAPEKASPAAPSISAGTPGVSPPPEIPAAGEGKSRKISSLPSPGRAAEPVDSEKLSIVKRAVPLYPLFSRKRGEEGVAVILVTIESGRVIDAEVMTSSGSTRLDAAALRAARLWVFRGNVTVRARIPFLFQLEK